MKWNESFKSEQFVHGYSIELCWITLNHKEKVLKIVINNTNILNETDDWT